MKTITQPHEVQTWLEKLNQFRTTCFALISVTLLIGCTVVLLSARAHDSGKHDPRSAAEKPELVRIISTSRGPSVAANDVIRVETVILTRFGFEPNSIVRSHGEFILFVENRSEVGDVDLRLDKVAGNRVHQQHVPKERPDWDNLFKLEPGDYILTETNHPNFTCDIRITAH
jgi:hypothetical protein